MADEPIGYVAPTDKPWRRWQDADDKAPEAPTKPPEAPPEAEATDRPSERRRRT